MFFLTHAKVFTIIFYENRKIGNLRKFAQLSMSKEKFTINL